MPFEAQFTDETLGKMLKDMTNRVEDFKQKRRAALGLMSANVYRDITDHFQREEGSAGKWKKWSNAYARAMSARGKGGNRLLQDSGRLRQTFKPTSYRVMSDGVLWFNNAKTRAGAPYAYYHDEGVGNNPKRDFMWLSNKAMSKLEEELLQFVMGD